MRVLLIITLLICTSSASAQRIKDLASLAGVRQNQLIGYGLVVGLNGTGDQTTQTPFTVQSLKSMLKTLGVTIPPNINPQLKNVAAVMVHANLPSFARPGQTIDVTVSSIGNAKELRGGSLLMTPLLGASGEVYAIAQGNLVVGGFGAEGADGSKVTVNIPTAGRIPNGATVERAILNSFATSSTLTLQLNSPDFGTANVFMNTINQTFGAGTAQALDSTSIEVRAPTDHSAKVAFVAMLEDLEIQPSLAAAKVIVNSRTGTVVIGSHVRVSPAAITHGSLTVTVAESYSASQPAPFARRGETVVLPDSDVSVEQGGNGMFLFDPGVSLEELVQAVNKVGVAPGDLVAILEALKQVGALQAQLIVI